MHRRLYRDTFEDFQSNQLSVNTIAFTVNFDNSSLNAISHRIIKTLLAFLPSRVQL